MTTRETVRIARRFCGPARSGNGGYVAGLVGSAIDAATDDDPDPDTSGPEPVRVRLRRPPPLEVDLTLAVGPDGATLSEPDGEAETAESDGGPRARAGGGVVAEGLRVSRSALDDACVDPVLPEEARAAEASYGGLRVHPFPTCFVCGPDNPAGLRLFPGPVGEHRTACTWTPGRDLAGPDGLVGDPYLWAALDCPGGWTVDLEGRPLVLGELTARIDARPQPGEPCVVMGRWLGDDGRKTFTASTLYDGDGRVLARGRHTWIAVDPSIFE